MNQENQNISRLYYFLIDKSKSNYYFVVINQKLKVVHRYNKAVYNKDSDLSSDFLSFLDSIEISKDKFWSVAQTSESLIEAKLSVYINKKLCEMGENSKFSKLFNEPENE